MLYRSFTSGDVPSVMNLCNTVAKELSYKGFTSELEFEELFCNAPSFDTDGLILAIDDDGSIVGSVLAIRKVELLPDEVDAEVPGYISFLMVHPSRRNNGVGSMLLQLAEEYLSNTGRSSVCFSHKCPIKLSWYVNDRRHEHNKAPGIMIDSNGFSFLLHKGYVDIQHEVSYYLDLRNLILPDDVMNKIALLNEEGYCTTRFDASKHFGYEDMFKRLNDESFLQKFRNGIEQDKHLLVIVDSAGRVCGSAGTIFREEIGRGFFSALAVDPACGGKGIGTMLFFDLCQQLRMIRADYMTLFVTDTNFARKIYEKAGFEIVKEWAILSKNI